MFERTENLQYRPRLVLGYGDSSRAAQCARALRRLGWEVHQAGTAVEIRRLTLALAPDLVVLDTDLPDESGWLTCAKLRVDLPEMKIVLVDPQRTPQRERFAAFVGASQVISRQQDLTAHLEEQIPARVSA
jgi:DNA-binding response OmpR family regulator